MNASLQRDPLVRLVVAIGRQLARRPFLSASVAAHAVVLGLLYAFGSYELALSQQAADAVEVASSLRATHEASTTKRLQDLQTIKELLEKSAGREEAKPEPGAATEAPPQTPQEALERARELAREIETLDKDIKAEELARLTGQPKPPVEVASAPAQPVREPQAQPQTAGDAASEPGTADKLALRPPPPVAEASGAQAAATSPGGVAASAPVTAEAAAGEVAKLEAKARETLTQRLKRLEAQANGVQVETDVQGGQGGKQAGAEAPGRDGVRARIAEFIGQASERKTASTRYGVRNFFDQGVAHIPPVDASGLVLGKGRMFGKGGEYANRVYLNSWYIIGPFDGQHGEGMFSNPPHPPETAVLLDAVYYGKDQRVLRWHYGTAQSYPLTLTDNIEDSVYYGYTEVSVDEDCDLTAWIGADDDVQITLNDHLVWKGGNVNKATYYDAVFNHDQGYLRDYNRTEGKRVLHFNKGRNKLFFKLSNGPNGAYLSMVLTR